MNNSLSLPNLDASDQQELQRFQEQEGQRALVQTVISKLTKTCFTKCIYPGPISSAPINSTEESCLRDCVNRFMDVQKLVLSKAGAQ